MAETGDKSVSAAGIAAAARAAGKRGGPAPVHLWNPPYCGDLDIVIRADGSWWHEGAPINRPAMVRLFASILKREGDRFFLVTPVEKVGITVEDAPFLAVDAEIAPNRITFTTNLGETVTASAEHPITVQGTADAPRPYIHVRAGLEALIDRKTFYRLADAAVEDEAGRAGLVSQGRFFPLEP